MKKTIAAIALAGLSATAFASDFDGVNVQLGIGGASTSTNVNGVSVNEQSPITANGKGSSGSANGLVSLGYSHEIPETGGFNLAANLFYVIGKQKAGNTNNSGTWNDGTSDMYNQVGAERKLKNTFGISVEPGWNFTKSSLGYVKLAWLTSQQNVQGSSYAYEPSTGNSNSGSLNESKRVNGFGYGLGFKQMITENIFGAVDLMGVTYGSATYGDGGVTSKPSQFMGFASIGYKF